MVYLRLKTTKAKRGASGLSPWRAAFRGSSVRPEALAWILP
jgi:hypothetical protein